MDEVSETCQKCGKQIAAMVKSEALCCKCRYRSTPFPDLVSNIPNKFQIHTSYRTWEDDENSKDFL